jgi:diguanylate cyclase (GGDEF)-like protein
VRVPFGLSEGIADVEADSIRPQEDVSARLRQQAAITDFSRQALTSTDLPQLFDAAAAYVVQILVVDSCAIFELLPDGSSARLVGGIGWREEYIGRLALSTAPDSHVGSILLAHEPVILDDLPLETSFDGMTLYHDHQIIGGLAVRIDGRERPYGIVAVYMVQQRLFNTDERNFLQAIAQVLAATITRHQTEEALRQMCDALEHRVDCLRTELHRCKQIEQQLAHEVMHDPLTGLPNRVLFSDRLRHTLECAQRRDGAPFAVVFLDLDGFKAINDRHGHLAADQLLVEIARRLEACLRPGDTVARFGGDEFTVLLTELDDVRRALRVTQRISQALAGPINIDGHDLCLSGSIGIAFSSPEYDRPEAILHAADLAMYQAKAQGKPYPIIYDPALYSDRTQQSREPASQCTVEH